MPAADGTSCRSPARPTCPTACCARSTGRRSTIAAPSSQQLGQRVLDGMKPIFQTEAAGGDLSGLGHRRLGGGAGQHAVAGRPGADGRDRALRRRCGSSWPSGSGSRSSSSRRLARTAPTRSAIERSAAPRTRRTRSRRSASCTTRPRPACTSRIAEVRAAIDRAGHPALLMVDTISSLASIDYRHDEWGVDVTVGGLAEGPDAAAGPVASTRSATRRWRRTKAARLPRSYWDWDEMLAANAKRLLPLHAGDQPALRPRRGASTCCRRRGWRTSSPATTATPRRRARAVRGLGARDPVPGAAASIRAR